MKITIIGANSFLADSIGKYCNIIGIDIQGWSKSKNVKYELKELHIINLLNSSLCYRKLIDSEAIFYCVGAGIQSNLNEPFEWIYELNTFVPMRLYKELSKLNYKGTFITFGSYFEYGENSNDFFLTEEDIINAYNYVPNDYCLSKRLLTKFIASQRVKIKHYHFILPTIYGENENPSRLIPYILNSIKNNQELNFTDGEQIRQYLYVRDIPPIIFKCLEENIPSGIYNIAGNEIYKIKDLINHIIINVGKTNLIINFGSVKRDDTNMKILKLNGNKLMSKINLEPKTKIIDVLKKY